MSVICRRTFRDEGSAWVLNGQRRRKDPVLVQPGTGLLGGFLSLTGFLLPPSQEREEFRLTFTARLWLKVRDVWR